MAELGLDVEATLLGNDEPEESKKEGQLGSRQGSSSNAHVTVVVDERFLVHRRIGEVHVDGESGSRFRRALAGDGLHALDKVDLLAVLGEGERTPCDLGRRDGAARVGGRELGAELRDEAKVSGRIAEEAERKRLTSLLSGMRTKPWWATEGRMR